MATKSSWTLPALGRPCRGLGSIHTEDFLPLESSSRASNVQRTAKACLFLWTDCSLGQGFKLSVFSPVNGQDALGQGVNETSQSGTQVGQMLHKQEALPPLSQACNPGADTEQQ